MARFRSSCAAGPEESFGRISGKKDNYIKKVWELYLLYPMFRSSHLPSEWIKQQQPTPIGYMIPITGKYISNDAGAIAIIFIPESNCEV